MNRLVFLCSTLVALISIYVYTSSSGLTPVVWKHPSALSSLETNELLGPAEIKLENKVIGSESFAFDKSTGNVYTGLSDGKVIELSSTGEILGTILFVGGYIRKKKIFGSVGMYYDGVEGNVDLLDWCNTEALAKRLAFNVTNELECGRPLGTRIVTRKKFQFLYVIDAHYGVFRIKLTLGSKEIVHVINEGNSVISQITPIDDPVTLKPLRFMNDLAVLPDDRIIFTDSSYLYSRPENRQDILSGGPFGRLLEYNPRTNAIRVLLCGLHFPNGVQLIPSKEKGSEIILVVELTRFRILKVNLSLLKSTSAKMGDMYNGLSNCGEDNDLNLFLDAVTSASNTTSALASSGSVSIFASSLPGIPDNIRLNEYISSDPTALNDFLMVGSASLNARPFSLVHYGLRTLAFRHVFAVLIPPSIVEKFLPKIGLVLVYNLDGNLLQSFQSRAGKISMVSEGSRHPLTGDLWLGSHSAQHLAVLPSEHVPALRSKTGHSY